MWICALIRETETEVATTTWIPDLVPEVSPIQSQPTQAQAPAGPRAKEMNMAQDSRIFQSMNTNTDPEMKQNEQGLDVVTVVNEGALREEIEIELLSCGGKNFTGTITMQEAKHGIFRDCLRSETFKNFEGVRFAFKGVRKEAVVRSWVFIIRDPT